MAARRLAWVPSRGCAARVPVGVRWGVSGGDFAFWTLVDIDNQRSDTCENRNNLSELYVKHIALVKGFFLDRQKREGAQNTGGLKRLYGMQIARVELFQVIDA